MPMNVFKNTENLYAFFVTKENKPFFQKPIGDAKYTIEKYQAARGQPLWAAGPFTLQRFTPVTRLGSPIVTVAFHLKKVTAAPSGSLYFVTVALNFKNMPKIEI